MQDYNLNHCQCAKTLILREKSNYGGEETDTNVAQRVFAVTTAFINPIDMLTLEIRSVDEILPAVRDVYNALKSMPKLPSDYQGVHKVNEW